MIQTKERSSLYIKHLDTSITQTEWKVSKRMKQSSFLIMKVILLLLLLLAKWTVGVPLDRIRRVPGQDVSDITPVISSSGENPTPDTLGAPGSLDSPPVPPFVTELYDCWQKDKVEMRECLKSVDKSLEFDDIVNSNTVTVLIGKGTGDDGNLSNVDESNRPQYQSIEFNISSIQCSDDAPTMLQYTELRVHKRGVTHERLLSLSSSICPIKDTGVSLSLLTSLRSDGRDHVLESISISYDLLLKEGWIQFHRRLKPVLSEWMQQTEDEQRTFKLVLQGGCAGINLEEIGFDLKEDPLLVTFVRNKDSNKIEEKVMEQMARTVAKDSTGRSKRIVVETPKDNSCKLHPYNVNFTSLGWNDYILKPKAYKANYCAGSCVHPLSKHMNGTLHSELIAFSHILNPNKVPNPCCVPTRLMSATLVVKPDTQSIQIKAYPQMTAVECGCR